MPFNGNIGIHDASWRYSLVEKYIKEMAAMDVNSPKYLAKIYENIGGGTPVICYRRRGVINIKVR